jgi:hypothetical protein
MGAMLHGAHVIVYSKDHKADLAFFRDTLKLPHVDVGHGWLIFALPPAEIAVHPSERGDAHELYLMCDDVRAFVAEMNGRGLACAPIEEASWGALTRVTLPGGGRVGVYQPKHPSPPHAAPRGAKKKVAAKKKPASKKPATRKAAAKKKVAPKKKPLAKKRR